jgi:NADH-quinone oxidoreductase subunit A
MSKFSITLLFSLAAFLVVGVGLTIGKILRPQQPNPHKLSIYESGEEAQGTTWGSFNPRFYVVALVFLLFEVELLFFFPWAVVFTDPSYNQQTGNLWQWFLLTEITLFASLLAVALFYVWKKGVFTWKHNPNYSPKKASKVPPQYYDMLNKKYE